MEYFQIRKNSRQVLRIFRGAYEGLDITRIQLWYKNPGDDEYKPGRIVAFASELISGVLEGLVNMSRIEPVVETQLTGMMGAGSAQLLIALQDVLKRHRRPLHWENVYRILEEENPSLCVTKWHVYNVLLQYPNIFQQVEEDVFAARG